ncbi:MAG: hypothetical protein ACYTGC_07430 [Planctomycetota bacterium]|jgi:hypothetical protein
MKHTEVDWSRAKEIFSDLLEAPPTRRRAALMTLGDDGPLRAAVVRLLIAHDDAGSFLADAEAESRPPAADGPTPPPGARD